MEELCALVLSLQPAVEKISLLPYHRFGESKYTALGKVYPWKGVPAISEEPIAQLKKLAASHGIALDVGR